MQNNRETNKKLLELYKRYRDEILFEIDEQMGNSELEMVEESLLTLHRNEYHYHLEYFQKILINFLYFNDFSYLDAYLRWRYEVYKTRKIPLAFLLYENERLLQSTRVFIKPPFSYKMEKYHEYIEQFYISLEEKSPLREVKLQDAEIERLYGDALEGRRVAFAHVMQEAAPSLEAFCEFFTSKISAVLAHIGHEWQRNNITVAQEHRATALIRDAVYEQLESYPRQEPRNEKVLLSLIAGEEHIFSLELTKRILHSLGYEVAVMGGKFSYQDTLNILFDFAPKHIVLITTLPTSLMSLAELLEKIHKEDLELRPKCYVAGAAIGSLSNPYSSLECDYYFVDFVDFYKRFA